MNRKVSKTVFIKIWTPNMRHLAMVKNRAGHTPRGDHQPMSWGLIRGGQVDSDYDEKMLAIAGKICGQADREEEYLAEVATALRKSWEEAGIYPQEMDVKPLALAIEINPNHHKIVCDGSYHSNDISKGLHTNDPEGQVMEARWVPVDNLRDGHIDGLRIYNSHLAIINDERDSHYIYSVR